MRMKFDKATLADLEVVDSNLKTAEVRKFMFGTNKMNDDDGVLRGDHDFIWAPRHALASIVFSGSCVIKDEVRL